MVLGRVARSRQYCIGGDSGRAAKPRKYGPGSWNQEISEIKDPMARCIVSVMVATSGTSGFGSPGSGSCRFDEGLNSEISGF